jgi:hypothetical protein
MVKNTKIEINFRRRNMQEVLYDLGGKKYRYGLLYFDPYGFILEDYKALISFIQNNPRMDIILNINATQIKRNRTAYEKGGRECFKKYKEVTLFSIISQLNKKYIWIRDNSLLQIHSKYQWLLLFGTNTEQYDIKTFRFISIDTKEGQELLYKYNYTEKEKEEKNEN